MENKEANILVDEGLRFTIGKRKFHIKPLRYGTMRHANKYAVKMNIDLEDGNSNHKLFSELSSNITPQMRYIAINILGSYWKIKLFTKPFSRWLEWKLTPKEAFKLSMAIVQMNDLTNFISSIRLVGETSLTKSKTTPRVDTNKEDLTAHSEK